MAPRSGDGEGGSRRGSRRKSGSTERARVMRLDGTREEALLWIELKANRLAGYHFVRQYPIGPYITDFACRKARLIVEVDGSQHAGSGHDQRRDDCLRRGGWSTIRFWNEDIVRRRIAVCETILAALDGRLSQDVVAGDLRFIFASSESALKRMDTSS